MVGPLGGGARVAGPSLEAVDDDELEAQTQSATDAVRATVMRLLREDGIHPQLAVLAVARAGIPGNFVCGRA